MGSRIKIALDFSKTPGPRCRVEGKFSGQEFREEILQKQFLKAFANKEKLIIDLDGTHGYGTSFLEEAFGGLARENNMEDVLKTLEFISVEEEYLINDIIEYIKSANA